MQPYLLPSELRVVFVFLSTAALRLTTIRSTHFKVPNSPDTHAFGLWEEAGDPEEQRTKMQTPTRRIHFHNQFNLQRLQLSQHFIF